MVGIEMLAGTIREDMLGRLPGQNKKQREGLSLLVATMLDVRSANLMDLAASLPRAAERLDMRYQWISRLLGNDLIEVDAVMAPYGRDVLARIGASGQQIVLIMDQTQLTARHQAVMVAVRIGERALPLSWRIKETQGAIGFADQREALEAVVALLPKRAEPVLMGDRFYGSPALIAWCRDQGWAWRLRLKQGLLVFEHGGETTLADCFARGEHMLTNIELTEKRVATNVAMVHEAGHPEPWIIALSEAPTIYRAFDYGLRWGIEPMFSDFKTRGFGIEDSHIQRTDRLDRLILVMALALFWPCPSACGMWSTRPPRPKKTAEQETPQPAAQLDIAVQTRHPPHPDLHPATHPHPAPLGSLEKLMGGKEDAAMKVDRALKAALGKRIENEI